MYNKSFSLYIQKTDPFSEGIGENMTTGLVITGILRSQEAGIFSDVQFGDNKAGLETVITPGLPISYPVKLLFSPRHDTVLLLDKEIEVECDLDEIKVSLPDDEGKIDLTIKITIPEAEPDEIGDIVSLLKHTVSAQIKSTQEELFDNAKA